MDVYSTLLKRHTKLQERLQHSREFLAEVQLALGQLPSGILAEICIFAAGSLGRFEAGRRSDLDVFLLADRKGRKETERSVTRLREIEIFSDLIKLNERLGLPPLSGDGRFLRVHEVEDLIQATGDSTRDDNENLFTTRLLLLLESKSISNDGLYRGAMLRVLNNYFRDGKGRRDFQPLFLLNDILRYWRTLCLNYERERTLQKPWWKKNLNLKFSRKLTIFATVLAIVSERLRTTEQFLLFAEQVPLERLASTLDYVADDSLLEKFGELLNDYESFLAAKSFAELDVNEPERLQEFRRKAESMTEFFDIVFQSRGLKRDLVRYILI